MKLINLTVLSFRQLFGRYLFTVMLLASVGGVALAPVQALALGKEKTANVKIDSVNINKATAEEISKVMKGVGLKKAEAIVNWRKKNGKFTSLDQLVEVKGIGAKTIAANSKRLTL